MQMGEPALVILSLCTPQLTGWHSWLTDVTGSNLERGGKKEEIGLTGSGKAVRPTNERGKGWSTNPDWTE